MSGGEIIATVADLARDKLGCAGTSPASSSYPC